MTDRSKSGVFAADYPKQAPKFPKEAEKRLRALAGAAGEALAYDPLDYPEPQMFHVTPVSEVDAADVRRDGNVVDLEPARRAARG